MWHRQDTYHLPIQSMVGASTHRPIAPAPRHRSVRGVQQQVLIQQRPRAVLSATPPPTAATRGTARTHTISRFRVWSRLYASPIAPSPRRAWCPATGAHPAAPMCSAKCYTVAHRCDTWHRQDTCSPPRSEYGRRLYASPITAARVAPSDRCSSSSARVQC